MYGSLVAALRSKGKVWDLVVGGFQIIAPRVSVAVEHEASASPRHRDLVPGPGSALAEEDLRIKFGIN